MMKQLLFRHLLVVLLSTGMPVAFAAKEGTAVGVNPDAVAQINSADRILEVGADVSVGEMIVTGPAGQVQIVFDDNTRLVVGPRSSLLIETYLMASSNTAQKLTINALGVRSASSPATAPSRPIRSTRQPRPSPCAAPSSTSSASLAIPRSCSMKAPCRSAMPAASARR